MDAEIGERLHTWMWRHRVSQVDLAARIGISQPSLGRKLRGDSAWTAGELARAAATLDVPVGWLFGEAEPLTRWSGVWGNPTYRCYRCGWPSWELLCRACASADDYGLAA